MPATVGSCQRGPTRSTPRRRTTRSGARTCGRASTGCPRFRSFGEAVLQNQQFCRDFITFQKRIAFYGAINALAQVILKAMAPGIPDFYQGTELWDFSLVDPDNRRPIDYDRRRTILRQLEAGVNTATLLRRWFDGRVKLFVTWKA